MSALGWCAVCRLSLYLVEPSESHPSICRECLPTLIGQEVICPECVLRALMMEHVPRLQRKLLERVVDRTWIQLTAAHLAEPELSFPVCRHAVEIPRLLSLKAALVERCDPTPLPPLPATMPAQVCG